MRKTVLCSAILAAMLAGSAAAETLRIEVESAELGTDQVTTQPIVTIKLKPESKTAFGDFTRARVGEPVTVRVGATPISAPIIREPILEGTLVISGQLTPDSARELVDLISGNDGVLEVDGSDR